MKKVSIKTFYLLGVVSIGLIGLAIGSTYAMFTASAEISNPITISSNLTSNDDVMETFEVEIEPYKTLNQRIIINSGAVSNVNYGIWYINNITDVDMGILSTSTKTTGTIKDANTSVTSNIVLRNYSSKKKTVTLGIASSKNSIVLASNMTLVPQTVLGERTINTNASTYITKLYSTTEKSTVSNNSITYNTSPSQLLINDRKGSSSTGIDAGNLKYYGSNPDNYVYFNCSNYNSPTSSTCELWRIIGVFDGKLKLIRNSEIGEYSWDNKDTTTGAESAYGKNDWTSARLMKLLNPGYSSETTGGSLYYNSKSGNCYAGQNNATKACNFTSTGIKNDTTRKMISDTTYYLGGYTTNAVYPNESYANERGTSVHTGRPTTWQGKIALAYPSDYGYAVDLGKCLNKQLNAYNENTCTSNNWMKSIIAPNYGWLLTHRSDTASQVWRVESTGFVNFYVYAYSSRGVMPVVYLNSDTIFTTGEGTKDSPYKIKSKNLAAHITSLYESSSKTSVTNNSITYKYDKTNKLMKDVAGNTRYYGASPNNYIYFNCSNYANQSSSTCEIWRIIGVFNGKVKLIRNSKIGEYSWDNKNVSTGAESAYGKNDWTSARLMKLLNPGYSSESTGGSLYYNAKSGNCYSGQNNITTACNFTSTGIKNPETRNLISDTTYYLGGYSTSSLYSNQIYEYERGTTVYTGRPTTWKGKVALAYPSDYGYAVDFEKCSKQLGSYSDSTCTSNNWLKPIITTSRYNWLLNPYSKNSYDAYGIDTAGKVHYLDVSVHIAFGVVPVIHLDPKLSIKSGDGSSSKPYQLSTS